MMLFNLRKILALTVLFLLSLMAVLPANVLYAATGTNSFTEKFMGQTYMDSLNTSAIWANGKYTLRTAVSGESMQVNPSVALDSSGNYVVVWLDRRGGSRNIYAAKYSSSGTKLWGDTKINTATIGTPSSYEPTPKVECYGGYIYVLYASNQGSLFLQKHDSNGNQLWRVSAGAGDWTGYTVCSDRYYGYLYVAYTYYGTSYISKFNSSGTKLWGPVSAGNGNAYDVSVAAYYNYVYVAHRDVSPGNTGSLDICKINPSTGAKSWTSDLNVGSGTKIRIGVDTYGNPCVVYNSSYTIYYTKYNPSGYRFITPIVINSGYSGQEKTDPEIAVGSGNVKYLTWLDKFNGTYGLDTRVKGQKLTSSDYIILPSGGIQMSHDDLVLQKTPSVCPVYSSSPSATNGLFIAWSDDASGYSNIMANTATSTTRAWTNDICINNAPEYSASSQGQSLGIDSVTDNITAATLTYNTQSYDGSTPTLNVFGQTYSLFGQSASFYLSNNGGASWYAVTPGTKFTFPVSGSDLRFRVGLNSTNYSIQPKVEDVTITYDYNGDSTAPTGAPSTPTDQGSYINATSLTFNWTLGTSADPESGISGYYLQIASDTGFASLIFNGDVGNVLTKSISGCAQGVTYYARVRVKNGTGLYGGYSATSDGIKIDTTQPIGTPTVPTDAGAISNSYTITFNWAIGSSSDAESGISGYWLQVSSDPGFATLFYNADVGNVTSKSISGTANGATYYARVRARNGSLIYTAYSAASDGITVQAPDTTAPTGAPSVPTDAGQYTYNTTITFNWTAGTAADQETGIAGYYLQVSNSTSFSTLIFDGDVGNVLTRAVPNGVQGSTYYARVRAKNGANIYGGYSGASNGIMVDSTGPTGQPATPTDAGSTSSSTTISFSWTQGNAADPESGIAGFWLQVSTNTAFSTVKFDNYVGNASSATISGCTDGLTYYARVKPINGAGVYGTYSPASNGILIQISGSGGFVVYGDNAWNFVLHNLGEYYNNTKMTAALTTDPACTVSPAQGATCTKFTFDKSVNATTGAYSLFNGWDGPGTNLTGKPYLTFKARADVAGVKMRLGMGLDYSGDTTVRDMPNCPITLNTTWTTYSMDLSGGNLSSINCFWFFTVYGPDCPGTQVVFYIDDVKYVSSLTSGMSAAGAADPSFVEGESYIFPNPAKAGKKPTLHVEVGIADKVEINIYDVAGDLIDSKELTDMPDVVNGKYAYEYQWDTSDKASGVYIARVIASNNSDKIKITKKFAVVK